MLPSYLRLLPILVLLVSIFQASAAPLVLETRNTSSTDRGSQRKRIFLKFRRASNGAHLTTRVTDNSNLWDANGLYEDWGLSLGGTRGACCFISIHNGLYINKKKIGSGLIIGYTDTMPVAEIEPLWDSLLQKQYHKRSQFIEDVEQELEKDYGLVQSEEHAQNWKFVKRKMAEVEL